MSEHALLSASGSHMWLNCPPSARLGEQYPDSTSVYAAEGTLGHAIGELKLQKTFFKMPRSTFNSKLKKLREMELFDSEMLTHTDTYHDLVYATMLLHPSPFIAVEKKLDYSMYAPEGFGTGDCIIIGGDTLYVIDFKYGKGVPVDATYNSQMMLYALGAYQTYSFLFKIKNVKVIVCQPRLDSTSEWEISVEDLLAWGESIKLIAAQAFAGEGEQKAGDHCRWCRVKAICKVRADMYLELAGFDKAVPPILSNDSLGAVLIKAQGLSQWVSELEEYALTAILRGESIAGWKAVEGRSNRKIADVEGAFEILKTNGFDEAILYNRVPLGLTDLEALVGKKVFIELLATKVEKPQGKPTLAPTEDKRAAFVRGNSAKEDFATPFNVMTGE